LELVDDFIGTQYVWREVFSESMKLKHPEYDIFYLVVARRNDAVVLTKDRRLMEAAHQLGVKVADN
jgi:predicted nucleic acid-binding protein